MYAAAANLYAVGEADISISIVLTGTKTRQKVILCAVGAVSTRRRSTEIGGLSHGNEDVGVAGAHDHDGSVDPSVACVRADGLCE